MASAFSVGQLELRMAILALPLLISLTASLEPSWTLPVERASLSSCSTLLVALSSLVHEQLDASSPQGHRLSDNDVLDHPFKGIDLALYGRVHQVLYGELEGGPGQDAALLAADAVAAYLLDLPGLGHYVGDQHDVAYVNVQALLG